VIIKIRKNLWQKVDICAATQLKEADLAVPSTQSYTGLVSSAWNLKFKFVDQVLAGSQV
jgi:hypothetical protein